MQDKLVLSAHLGDVESLCQIDPRFWHGSV